MGKTEIANPLNSLERTTLRNAEKVVDGGKTTFLEVGSALKTIQDGALYRETHKSFQAYVEERHEFKRAWAYRLIQGATVAQNLSSVCDTSTPSLPSRQVEALAKLPAEQQAAAWLDAKDASDGDPSTEDVEASVETYLAADEPYVEPGGGGEEEEEPPEPVLDARKQPVDEHLEDAFQLRPEFLAIRKEYTALEKRVEEIAKGEAGVFLDWETIRRDSRNIKEALKFGTPYAPCPYCGGKKGGCPALKGQVSACRKTGFVSEGIWKAAPAEKK